MPFHRRLTLMGLASRLTTRRATRWNSLKVASEQCLVGVWAKWSATVTMETLMNLIICLTTRMKRQKRGSWASLVVKQLASKYFTNKPRVRRKCAFSVQPGNYLSYRWRRTPLRSLPSRCSSFYRVRINTSLGLSLTLEQERDKSPICNRKWLRWR